MGIKSASNVNSKNAIWETYVAPHTLHLECLLVSLFSFVSLSLPLPVKRDFAGTNYKVHWKMSARKKICSKIFKNTCEGATAKIYFTWFTILHMKVPVTRNFPTLSKLSEKLLEVTPRYFKYTRLKAHKT